MNPKRSVFRCGEDANLPTGSNMPLELSRLKSVAEINANGDKNMGACRHTPQAVPSPLPNTF